MSNSSGGGFDAIELQAADPHDGSKHIDRRRKRQAYFTQTDQGRMAPECGRGISARRAVFFRDLE